ncbi:WD-repeat protein, putative [Entamoeba invadens IP1]|uniref:WD-repeat protein, putative n=1 Tax=Entamoeba invadens IP1 TaxID=370355 RepID=A0A0A1U4L2_ENTIV|nr:WD-repeat protein, putative [Entamoeba invadens IP1]ELP89197.1 WD-repeat protein, putative [Entamoeba invadens IP1]|eukprot:XP_004255968.1 WD-repeat protein, putative [Entamoeba invadens IP1]
MNKYELENVFGVFNTSGNMCFSSDSTTLYSCSGNRIHVTNLLTNTNSTFSSEARNKIRLLAVDSHDTMIVAVLQSREVELFSLATRNHLTTFESIFLITCVKFSPKFPLLAVGYEGKIEIWRMPILSQSTSLQPELQSVTTFPLEKVVSIQWMKHKVIFMTESNNVFMTDCKGSEPVRVADWSFPVVCSSLNENTLTLVSSAGALQTFEYDANTKTFEAKSKFAVGEVQKKIQSGDIGQEYAVFNVEGEVILYETTSYTKVHAYKTDTVTGETKLSPSGLLVAVGDPKTNYLTVYEWKTETYLMKAIGHQAKILCHTISPNGQFIATGDRSGAINVWNIGTGENVAHLNMRLDGDIGLDCAVHSMVFSPNSLSLISVGGNGKICVFDMVKKKCYRVLQAKCHELNGVVVEPRDGDIIAAYSSEDMVVFLYSVRTSKNLDELRGHSGPITDMCIHPVTSELMTTSWDKTARCVNFLSNSSIEIIDHPAEVMACSVNQSGSLYITSCRDGYLYLYDCEEKSQVGLLSCRNDLVGGVKLAALANGATMNEGTSYNSTQKMVVKEKYAGTVKFLSDNDEMVVIGGNSKFIVYYNIVSKVMIYKTKITEDMSYINMYDSIRNKMLRVVAAHSTKKEIYTESISVSPAGKTMAILTDAGVQMYTSGKHAFQPYCLTEAITPEAALQYLEEKQYLMAFVFALHLNDEGLIKTIFRTMPSEKFPGVAAHLPIALMPIALQMLQKELNGLLVHRAIYFTALLLQFHASNLLKPSTSLSQTAIPSSFEYLPHLRTLFKSIGSSYKAVSSQSQQTLALVNMCLNMPHFLKESEKKEEIKMEDIEIVPGNIEMKTSSENTSESSSEENVSTQMEVESGNSSENDSKHSEDESQSTSSNKMDESD